MNVVLTMRRLGSIAVVGVALVSTCVAQPAEPEVLVDEAFAEMVQTTSGRILAGLRHEREEYRTLAVSSRYTRVALREEQEYIERILQLSLTGAYRPEPSVPDDPLDSEAVISDAMVLVADHAQLLDADSARCWMERDYRGALRRVAGWSRLAMMLADSGDAMSAILGHVMLSHVAARLGTMADAAEESGAPIPALAIEEIRIDLPARDDADPFRAARLMALGMRRSAAWMRETFVEGDITDFPTYVEKHGMPLEDLVLAEAIALMIVEDAHHRTYYAMFDWDHPDLDEADRMARGKFWRDLTPQVQAEALDRARVSLAEGASSNAFVLRIYPDAPAHSPSREVLTERLGAIESLAARIEQAATREEMRQVWFEVFDAIDADRTQATRIAAPPRGTLQLWRRGLDQADAAHEALDRMLELADG